MTASSTTIASRLPRLQPVFWRAATVLAYGAVGAASLVPRTLRPSSGLVPGPVEHFAAYLVLGVIATYALRGRLSPAGLAALNALYAGLLEVAQLWVPGRISAPVDFAASTLGSCLGIVLTVLVLKGRRNDHATDSRSQ